MVRQVFVFESIGASGPPNGVFHFQEMLLEAKYCFSKIMPPLFQKQKKQKVHIEVPHNLLASKGASVSKTEPEI